MVSINREAMKLVREIITDANRLGIKVNKMNLAKKALLSNILK